MKAAEADTSIDPAAITMGWLYTRNRDLKKGGEWMEYAVKLAPESVKARIGLASWLLEMGRADEARTHAEAAAKLDPKSNEVRRLMGLAARQRKDFAAAEQVLQALAQESPGDAGLRNQLALVLAEQADDSKRRRAIELAELSVRQDPNSAEALTTLGIVYYRNKRLDDAAKVLQSVFASGRGNSDGAYVLALALSDQGHPENVATLLKSALEAQGLFVFRNDAQQWLDRLSAKAK